MFQSVKRSYGNNVPLSVTIIAMGEEVQVPTTAEGEEVLELTNLIIPGLGRVLAPQRRDYGISKDFPAQFPVDEQAPQIDNTPVHNLAMERQCGTTDHHLKNCRHWVLLQDP